MRKPSEVIGECLTVYERQDSEFYDRQFMCHIVQANFPHERDEVCEIIREAIGGYEYGTLIGYLINTTDDYPLDDETLAYEYRYKWWQDLIKKLEAEGK